MVQGVRVGQFTQRWQDTLPPLLQRPDAVYLPQGYAPGRCAHTAALVALLTCSAAVEYAPGRRFHTHGNPPCDRVCTAAPAHTDSVGGGRAA